MKCEVNSNTAHNVLISKEISYNNYKEICSGEPKKVKLGTPVTWLTKVEQHFFEVILVIGKCSNATRECQQ